MIFKGNVFDLFEGNYKKFIRCKRYLNTWEIIPSWMERLNIKKILTLKLVNGFIEILIFFKSQ